MKYATRAMHYFAYTEVTTYYLCMTSLWSMAWFLKSVYCICNVNCIVIRSNAFLQPATCNCGGTQ